MSALETTMRYKSKGKAHSSKFKSKTNKDDWSQVTDPQERRRIQNRVAQRKFRNKAKEVKERQARDAEEHVRASNFYIKPEPNEWGDENELSGLPWGSSSGFGRGRTLRRRDSNTSLLSERLSEATRRHIENSTSRPCTPSDSFPRGQSPFRPESPFYTPPSPFTDTFGNPSVNPFVLWGGLYRSPSVRDVKPAESIEANSVEESTQLENAHYFPDLAASPSVDHESSKSLSEQTSKSADPERESGGNDSHQNSVTSQVINVTNSRRVLGMPIDAHRALQAADERRARNASASARFRQRRKEKEKEASATIEKMQQQIRVLERKITSRGLFNKPFDAYRTSNVADFEKTLPDDAGSSARFRQRQKQKVQETSTVIEKMQQHIKELQCVLEENGEIILHSTLPSSTSPASEDVVLKASSETCAQPPNESKADFHTTGPVKPSSVPSKSSMEDLRLCHSDQTLPQAEIANISNQGGRTDKRRDDHAEEAVGEAQPQGISQFTSSDLSLIPEPPVSSKPIALAENTAVCSICQKFTGRPSEIRKHMRRHERPYGCTYPLCTKSFGSKFDWRRHEQYQHAEPWKDQPDQLTTSGDVRDIPSTDSPNENSRQRWHHQLDSRDSDTAQDETGRGLAGGSTGSRAFWCGFCDGFVPVAIELARAWTERSDHITNHFIRDEKRIEEWIVAN